jgi:hypothetical protein
VGVIQTLQAYSKRNYNKPTKNEKGEKKKKKGKKRKEMKQNESKRKGNDASFPLRTIYKTEDRICHSKR